MDSFQTSENVSDGDGPCPECGRADDDFGLEVEYCNACGAKSLPDEVLRDLRMVLDCAETFNERADPVLITRVREAFGLAEAGGGTGGEA